MEVLEFLYNTVYDRSKEAPTPKTSPTFSTVSIELWVKTTIYRRYSVHLTNSLFCFISDYVTYLCYIICRSPDILSTPTSYRVVAPGAHWRTSPISMWKTLLNPRFPRYQLAVTDLTGSLFGLKPHSHRTN